MTSDQLISRQKIGAEIFFGSHSSWGFGMAVNIQRDEPWMTPGRFGWNGGFGVSFARSLNGEKGKPVARTPQCR